MRTIPTGNNKLTICCVCCGRMEKNVGYRTKSGMHDARPPWTACLEVTVGSGCKSYAFLSPNLENSKLSYILYIKFIAILNIFINVHHAHRNEPCVEFLQ